MHIELTSSKLSLTDTQEVLALEVRDRDNL